VRADDLEDWTCLKMWEKRGERAVSKRACKGGTSKESQHNYVGLLNREINVECQPGQPFGMEEEEKTTILKTERTVEEKEKRRIHQNLMFKYLWRKPNWSTQEWSVFLESIATLAIERREPAEKGKPHFGRDWKTLLEERYGVIRYRGGIAPVLEH